MTLPRLDNFWSGLASGFDRGAPMGHDAAMRAQQLEAERQAREAQQRMQVFGMILNQNAQTGTVPHTEINRFIEENGPNIPGLASMRMAGPSKAEMAHNISTAKPVAGSVPGPMGPIPIPQPKQFTREQYEFAGMTPPAIRGMQDRVAAAQARGAELQVPLAEANLNRAQYENDPVRRHIADFGERNKAFAQIAAMSAQEAISRIGGPQAITPALMTGGKDKSGQTLPPLEDRVYQELESSGYLKQFGVMGDEQKSILKGMIGAQLNEAYLEWYKAQTSRIAANNSGYRAASASPWDRMHDNILNQSNAIKSEIDRLTAANPGLFGVTGGVLADAMRKMPGSTVDATLGEYKELRERQRKLAIIAGKLTMQQQPTPEDIAFVTNQSVGVPAPTNAEPANPAGANLGNLPTATGGMRWSPDPQVQQDAQMAYMMAKSLPRSNAKQFLSNAPLPPEVRKALAKDLGFEVK